LIATFYNSAVDYYWIRPKTMKLSPGTAPEIKGYYNMLTASHPRLEDGRESSIEIAFERPISIAGNLRLALVPLAIGGMPDLGSASTALGCHDVGYYRWTERFRPRGFRDLLWEKLADRLGLGF
jgi:hypothetical protein